ncbi:MAG: hypothetical protein ACRD68_15830, partial [Pyrinomonadaceae bacterium]
LLNRTPRGWVVTLINNRGVYKPQQGLARVARGESAAVTLGLRGSGIAGAREWTTEQNMDVVRAAGGGESINLRVPPGGIRIVEILERR